MLPPAPRPARMAHGDTHRAQCTALRKPGVISFKRFIKLPRCKPPVYLDQNFARAILSILELSRQVSR